MWPIFWCRRWRMQFSHSFSFIVYPPEVTVAVLRKRNIPRWNSFVVFCGRNCWQVDPVYRATMDNNHAIHLLLLLVGFAHIAMVRLYVVDNATACHCCIEAVILLPFDACQCSVWRREMWTTANHHTDAPLDLVFGSKPKNKRKIKIPST